MKGLVKLSSLSFVAGTFSSLLGVGGGLILVPTLMSYRVPFFKSTGTALTTIPLVAFVGFLFEVTFVFLIAGEFDFTSLSLWRLPLFLALGGFIGVFFGANFLESLSTLILRKIFILILIISMIKNLYEGLTFETGAFFSPANSAKLLLAGTLKHYVVCIALGFIAGISAISLGIGGGLLVVPGLTFFIPEIPISLACSISLAAMIPTSLVASLKAKQQDRVDSYYFSRIIIFCLIGACFGCFLRLAVLDYHYLYFIFAGFLFYAVLRLRSSGQ